jgi:hypothetical protein
MPVLQAKPQQANAGGSSGKRRLARMTEEKIRKQNADRRNGS